MERAMLAHPAILWLINTAFDASNGYGTKMRPRDKAVPLAEPQYHVINSTDFCRALDDCIKHRLHVRRRTADDAEHLGRCRLMLQRFAQFPIALLQFFEQPHVLDGDYSLVGEGFEKSNLLIGKRVNLGSTNISHADRTPLAYQRRREYRATAHTLDSADRFWKLGCSYDHQIFNVD